MKIARVQARNIVGNIAYLERLQVVHVYRHVAHLKSVGPQLCNQSFGKPEIHGLKNIQPDPGVRKVLKAKK